MAQQWHPFQPMFRPAIHVPKAAASRPRVIKVNQAA